MERWNKKKQPQTLFLTVRNPKDTSSQELILDQGYIHQIKVKKRISGTKSSLHRFTWSCQVLLVNTAELDKEYVQSDQFPLIILFVSSVNNLVHKKKTIHNNNRNLISTNKSHLIDQKLQSCSAAIYTVGKEVLAG